MRVQKCLLTMAIACLTASAALASNLVVTSTLDDGSPGTLRSVIAGAADGDMITFSLGSNPAVIQLATQPDSSRGIDLTKSLTIQGPGVSQLTIKAVGDTPSNIFQVFHPDADNDINLNISGMTLENALYTISANAFAWDSGHTMTITTSNVAFVNDFQGISAIFGVNLNVSECTFTTSSYGLAIISLAPYPANVAVISRSTFDRNLAAIYSKGSSVTLINSTLSANGQSSSTFYAGIVADANSTTNVISTTIVSDPQFDTLSIRQFDPTATIVMRNSIIANGRLGNCALASSITSDGYNWDSDGTCGLTGAGDVSGSLINPLDPGFSGGLASNGGATQTIALASTSQALNAVPPADCLDEHNQPLTVDQRGSLRPTGPACDMGAFELLNPAFSALTAKLKRTATSFDLNAAFTLGSGSNGINPSIDGATLTVGNYTVAIPAANFKALTGGAKKGSWTYAGTISGTTLNVQIVSVGGNDYQLKATGSPASVGNASPVVVAIKIGDDSGSANVN